MSKNILFNTNMLNPEGVHVLTSRVHSTLPEVFTVVDADLNTLSDELADYYPQFDYYVIENGPLRKEVTPNGTMLYDGEKSVTGTTTLEQCLDIAEQAVELKQYKTVNERRTFIARVNFIKQLIAYAKLI